MYLNIFANIKLKNYNIDTKYQYKYQPITKQHQYGISYLISDFDLEDIGVGVIFYKPYKLMKNIKNIINEEKAIRYDKINKLINRLGILHIRILNHIILTYNSPIDSFMDQIGVSSFNKCDLICDSLFSSLCYNMQKVLLLR